jgi:hypothetical protein
MKTEKYCSLGHPGSRPGDGGDAEQHEVPAMWPLRRNDAYGHTVGI